MKNKNPYLKNAVKLFKDNNWDICWLDPNVVMVSFDKETAPFLNMVCDLDSFDGVLLSFAVDFTDAGRSADITAQCMTVAPTQITEGFFCDGAGNMYFGEDAVLMSNLASDDLLAMEVKSKHVH